MNACSGSNQRSRVCSLHLMLCVLGEEDFAQCLFSAEACYRLFQQGLTCAPRAGIRGLQGSAEFSRLTFPNAMTLSELLTCCVVAHLSIH